MPSSQLNYNSTPHFLRISRCTVSYRVADVFVCLGANDFYYSLRAFGFSTVWRASLTRRLQRGIWLGTRRSLSLIAGTWPVSPAHLYCSTPALFALAFFPFRGKQRQAEQHASPALQSARLSGLPARPLSRLASLLWLVSKVQYLHSPSPTKYTPPHPLTSPKPSPPARPTAPLSFVVLDIVVAVVVVAVVAAAAESPLVANVCSLSSTLAAYLLLFSFLCPTNLQPRSYNLSACPLFHHTVRLSLLQSHQPRRHPCLSTVSQANIVSTQSLSYSNLHHQHLIPLRLLHFARQSQLPLCNPFTLSFWCTSHSKQVQISTNASRSAPPTKVTTSNDWIDILSTATITPKESNGHNHTKRIYGVLCEDLTSHTLAPTSYNCCFTD